MYLSNVYASTSMAKYWVDTPDIHQLCTCRRTELIKCIFACTRYERIRTILQYRHRHEGKYRFPLNIINTGRDEKEILLNCREFNWKRLLHLLLLLSVRSQSGSPLPIGHLHDFIRWHSTPCRQADNKHLYPNSLRQKRSQTSHFHCDLNTIPSNRLKSDL